MGKTTFGVSGKRPNEYKSHPSTAGLENVSVTINPEEEEEEYYVSYRPIVKIVKIFIFSLYWMKF